MRNFIGLILLATTLITSGAHSQETFKTETIVGIGATLEKLADGTALVDFLVPNAPAERAGMAVGDIIHEVKSVPNGEVIDVRSLPLADIVALIRGQVGVPVEIWFTRGNSEHIHLTILREKFVIGGNE